jgi:hypothetical protein
MAESRVRRAAPRYLRDTPGERSNIRRPMGPDPLDAEWELRLDDLRVFYDIHEDAKRVLILRAGEKRGNALYLHGVKLEMRL